MGKQRRRDTRLFCPSKKDPSDESERINLSLLAWEIEQDEWN